VRRRSLLLGGAGVVGLTALGTAALASDAVARRIPLPGLRPEVGGPVPDAAEGLVRLETVTSQARGREVGLWTAVPAGHGDGAGLPVCLVLHGASATTADFSAFGLARFLTAAVEAGVAPFVLAGADGGRTLWEGEGPGSADDPQRMLAQELPDWCAQRGFDARRLAAYGWSMGGYGALRAAELRPGTLRAVAALSPAVSRGDAVFRDAGALQGRRTGLWCGRSDSFSPAVHALAESVPGGAAVARWGEGGHTRGYWNTVTPAAFALVGRSLAGG